MKNINHSYNITIHSISRFIITLILLMCSSLFLLTKYTPKIENEFLSFFQFFSVFLISFFLSIKFATAKILIIFSKEDILHNWKRQYFLSSKKNISISWNSIEYFTYNRDRTYNSFILFLKNNKKYQIDQLTLISIHDDFNKMIHDFSKTADQDLKNVLHRKLSNTKIKEKNFYANKAFRFTFYVMTTIFLVLLVNKIFNRESTTSWSSLGIIATSLLFYGQLIVSKK